MKLIKSILALALVLTIAMSLAACGGDAGKAPNPTAAPTEAAAPTAAPTEAPADNGKTVYTVTVVDEAGNPVAGAFVQLCLDSCTPRATDENGVATYEMDEAADYKVSFVMVPEGYVAEEAYYFADGSLELTITLKAA